MFQCEQATTKSLKGVNYAAQKLLDYQRNGDPPNHVSSSLMKMTLTRQSPSDINDAALNGGVVTFKIPEELKKDRLGAFNTVNTKVSCKTIQHNWCANMRVAQMHINLFHPAV